MFACFQFNIKDYYAIKALNFFQNHKFYLLFFIVKINQINFYIKLKK